MLKSASYYDEITRGRESKFLTSDLKLNVDLHLYESIKKESSLVGMVMAWSVVALESLINHGIAEKINNKMVSVIAIEHPRQITEKFRSKFPCKSELAKKLIILNDNCNDISKLIVIADRLADIRNFILHDKPFSLIEHENGEVQIEDYKIRGSEIKKQFRFKELNSFFERCDKIKEFVEKSAELNHLELSGKSFIGMLNG